jgi:hypothetical protein
MSMLIKIFEMFLGFTGGKGLFEKSQFFTQQVVNNIRQMVIIFIVTLASLALFCIGLSMAIENYVRQMDRNHFFEWTFTFSGGLILAGSTLIALIICLHERTWMRVMSFEKKKPKEAPPKSHPIEDAISLLIIDYVQERQAKRQPPSPNQNNKLGKITPSST